MQHWLVKSEGSCYSIDDLKRDKKTSWSGVRNFQARNFMRDKMKVGDLILFYHSSSMPTGIYGIANVSSIAHPDVTQFDKKDSHYDPKSKTDNPTWMCVDISFLKKFKEPVSLDMLKFDPALEGMMVRARGSRLSIQPVSEKHYTHITQKLAR
jgi:predicted RNA-binding protein with PUA-like domain